MELKPTEEEIRQVLAECKTRCEEGVSLPLGYVEGIETGILFMLGELEGDPFERWIE